MTTKRPVKSKAKPKAKPTPKTIPRRRRVTATVVIPAKTLKLPFARAVRGVDVPEAASLAVAVVDHTGKVIGDPAPVPPSVAREWWNYFLSVGKRRIYPT